MLEKIDYEGANVWSISKPFRLGSAPDCMAADILRQIYQIYSENRFTQAGAGDLRREAVDARFAQNASISVCGGG